jgi:amino acid adenylation domain-containing protein
VSTRIKDFEKLSPAKQKLLLARLRKREEAEHRAEGIPRSPLRETGGPFPLSFAQQRLWFIDRMAPGSSVYNVADALLLEGRLDIPALERTLGALVERHEALRTVFDAVEGRPVQVVLPPLDDRFPIPVSDLSDLDPERADAEARRLAEAEAILPFDVPRGPHLRARLVRLPSISPAMSPGKDRWLALLTMHHIVSDGWSMGVLVRELGAFYRAFAGGGVPALPELPVQYPDFADWQRRTLQGEALEEHIRWWRERLAGAPPTFDLPADHPRPPVQGHRGAALRDLLPAETAAAVNALAQKRGATPFMVLLAAFALHLARHAGQDDVVVGSPVANRNRLDTEGLLGFFVNTLVLRVDAGGQPERTFLDLLDEVKGTTLGAYAHQDLPFERLVEELKPERDLSRSPLFQITFALQNAPVGDLELPGLTLAPLPLSPSAAVVDLSVDATETPEGIATDWRYDIDLFEPLTVRRLMDRFSVLLRAALADPARPLDSLPLLPEAERGQILTGWSAGPPAAEVPLFPDQFAAWAERTPEAPALLWSEEVWTYAELASRAAGLARTLLAMGIEPEARIGICLERSPDLIASMLAAFGAGMPFVPLDPVYPTDRLAYMAADAELAVLLTTRSLAERVPLPEGARAVFLEETGERAGAFPAVRLDPDTLAYVLYTSGSTGRPKGVMVPHRGVANLGALQRARFGVTPESRLLQFASPSFDASVFEVTLALGSGASLQLAPREALLPGPDFARQLAAWGITHAILSPSALAVTPSEGLPGLACLIIGGEACPPALVARWGAGRLFVNGYGPTEATICATAAFFPGGEGLDSVRTPIGHPLAGLEAYVVDHRLHAAPAGVPGELWLGGQALARGYHRRPDLTAERFVPHPFTKAPGARLYRTGDLVRWRPDGALDFLGRIDRQVKVRGVRIEPGEIEGILSGHPGVREAAVDVRVHAGDRRLVAWVALHPEANIENPGPALRAWAAGHLPEALVPASFVLLPELPVTPAGKVDREALPDPERGSRTAVPAAPRAGLESLIAGIWREVLGAEQVGREESFFDLGGHSLLLVEVQSRLRDRLGREVPILDLFRYPDVASLAAFLAEERAEGTEEELVPVRRERPLVSTGSRDIAVIALSCRFPGAPSPEAFWENLRAGVESIRFFSDEELLAAGVDSALLADPAYVRASGVLDDSDRFDAPFFDISPREAQIMDPQQRVILECAAEALERAGQGAGSPALAGRRVGVFAGTGMSVYGINVASVPGVDVFEATLANDKDFIATRIAYELDLRGPAMTVQTACSTSLVAVHLACKALLDGECELALAGGVTIEFPQVTGYLWKEGGITSPDGHNRAFDARARGTVGGNGAGMVVLKPLAAALADGDPIHAVIKATALNNDGSEKIGFTAPSERGQAEVIAEAQELAGVPPETIGYVEAHGSATPLGDPIEAAALMRAFRARASAGGWPGAVGFVPIKLGSVKTNVGHTGSAAGVAGLIKTVLALRNREIPPSLWYEEPNPRIDFSAGPFQVATALTPWEPAPGVPRRAGVSSFGLGGTNAHAVLEEAPESTPGGPGRSRALIVLSARTPTALETATDRLAAFLRERPELDLGDVAFTLLTGRKAHEHRRIVVAADAADAAAALAERDPRRVLSASTDTAPRAVAFVLAGLGEQYPGLARGLYEEEPVFREELDRCAEILAPWLGIDIREALFAGDAERGSGSLDLRRLFGRGEAAEQGPLDRTEVLQPALFAVEYALARLWRSWGIAPAALIGYSLGEYVAACLAEVFSLEDALRLVTERARWIGGLPAGAMLAVPLPEEELRPWIEGTELDLAATNGPRTCVVSGPPEAVAELERRLGEAGLPARRLRTTHAFHSRALWPVAERLIDLVREIGPRPPRIPLLSNVTGTWMTDEQATDPGAWAEHLLRPVRFAEGIAELWREPGRVLLEIGPGQSLSSLALQHPAAAQSGDPVAVASLPSAYERRHDLETVLGTLGKLWLAGVAADWPAVWAREERRRVELPAYPFERQRYWLQAGVAPIAPALPNHELDRLSREADALLETVRGAAGLDPDGMRAALGAIEERAQALSALLRPGATSEPMSAAISLHPRPGLRTPYAEPATELERTVTGLWQRLLGIDQVGRHDSFFDLGGDSLLATQALTRFREIFGVDIPMPSLFEDPTPAGAAALIERLRGAAGGETTPREVIPRQPRDGRAFPTSFAQERLWVIDQIEPGGIAYNLPTSLRLLGRLRTDLLARIFAEIIRRHETLRTTFAPGSGGSPVQIIHAPGPVEIPLIDLAALPSGNRETEVRRLAVEEGSRPFDLAGGPVLRIRLLRLAAEEHALLLTLHHIASDGWSNGVLVQEFAALYDAFSHGRPSPLPELPVQYADYAAWQRQVFQGPEIAASLDWWSRQLADAPVLELPTDRPRPPVQGTGGGFVRLEIPGPLGKDLEALARQEGATLFMVVTAVFQALLSRLSGQEDLTVGTPVANRHRTEVEGLIGFFVNTLVLRTDLSGDPPFRELLARVRRVSLDALEHGEMPFSQIVEALRPERSLSHTPLFQVMCQFAGAPGGTLEIPGLRFEALEAPIDSAMFDLHLTVTEIPGGLSAGLEYRTDLFDRATAERLLERYAGMLAAIAVDPEVWLSELPLLTEGERQVMAEWDLTPWPPLPSHTLPPGEGEPPPIEIWIATQARRTPGAPALVEAGQTWTYAEVHDRAARLAGRLRQLGVGPGSRVGICARRSREMVEAVLASLLAGAAYVPFDPAYPAERLAFMLEDSRIAVLLTQEELRAALPPFHGPTVLLGETIADPAAPAVPASPQDLAYVIYTSGSTGRPKGVEMTRAALLNLLAVQERVVLPGAARTLQFASLSFDVSAQEIISTWVTGGTLVLVDEETRRDPFALLALLDRERVERVFLPFVALRQLAEAAETAGGGVALRDVVTAGEQLQVTRAVRGWLGRIPGVRLYNQYGPTESHVVVTTLALEGAPESWPPLPPIGRPLPNVPIRILDSRLHLLPIGVRGELCIGGVALARGYLGRPGLTAERFVPDPLSEVPGARLYRTGDLARWRMDGVLEYLGRRDHQVKIRGVRVEPGEVEAVLEEHPDVRQAVVLAVPEPGSEALRLVAWYVGSAEAADLRVFLQDRLPAAIVPSLFVPLEVLPVTPSGKVDRLALSRGHGLEGQAAQPTSTLPRTPTEERLAAVWQELLGMPQVGVEDNFFELGGHSLLATRLVSRLREVFRVEIPQRLIFEAPTLEGLARALDSALNLALDSDTGPAADFSAPIEPVPGDGPFPVSFSQERLWLIDRIEPGSVAYNVPASLRLTGPLRPEVLTAAFGEIVRRHATLRTTYGTRDGVPVQVIAPPAPFVLSVIDLSGLSDRLEHAGRVATELALHPFDLARGPILRTGLLRLGEADHILLCTIHHIATDGWSTGLLIRELLALYDAFSRGLPSPLAPLPVRYADYAVWQRRTFHGEILSASLDWWREELADVPLLELPTDRPRTALPGVSGAAGAVEPLLVPGGTVDALQAFARGEGATLFMVLMAAFQALLARHTGQTDLAVGTPVAGRDRTELEELIGFFVNTLVVRTDLSGEPSFRELLDRVRRASLAAFAHQQIPFEKLVGELSPERSLAHSPLFQVLFVLQNTPGVTAPAEEAPGLRADPFEPEGTAAKFDITLSLAVLGGDLRGGIEYRAALFDASTIRRLLDHFAILLAGVVANPDRPLSDLPLMDAAEERLLRTDLNRAERTWASPVAVHDLFTRQARQTPEKTAAAGPQEAMTYREIDERSTALAALIRNALPGARLDLRIGLLADPDPQVLVGMIGILKAGGGFVPIDPRFPDERLAWMLEDSACAVLVTQERHRERVAGLATGGLRHILCLDDEMDEMDEMETAGTEPRDPRELRSLAYIVYTSGSTGRPKGVQISHENLVPMLLWGCAYLGLGESTRVLQNLSFGFDFGIFEHLTTLVAGGTLYFPGEAAGDPAALAQEIVRHGIDALHTTPAFARELAATGETLDSLRIVHLGGEALSPDTVARIREAAPQAALYNGYGPTEATVNSSIFRVSAPLQTIPIGRRSADNALYLLDRTGRLAPFGAPGELHVGGIGVARGYLNRPELTAELFVPDPFGGEPGGRLYRTGDLVRYLSDGGDIEFLGRIDQQVKIRGFRVEPGEIETLLAARPDVRDAAVVVSQDAAGKRLVACVVLDPGSPIAPSDLRAWLGERLPAPMVPAAFLVLDALPLTPNGKVDRRALTRLAAETTGGAAFEAPRTPVEELLAGLWASVLGVDRVGLHDDFFALGGHSLLATQLVSRVRELFGVEIPLRALFEAPTLAGLAARIEAEGGSPQGVLSPQALPPITPVPRDAGPLLLSFAQERLWFLDELDPGTPTLNMPFSAWLRHPLEDHLLARALNEIVRRHESLRTTFGSTDGQPWQRIAPALHIPLPVIDLRGLAPAAREREALRLEAAETLLPFDLARGPLVRARMVRTDEAERLFLLTVHHIVSDGWSLGLLMREMRVLYAALSEGEGGGTGQPSPLPELPVQYADYAAWQRRWLGGAALEAQIAYWRGKLGDPARPVPTLDLPADRPRPAVQTYRSGSVTQVLAPALTRRLASLGRREGATLFMVLLAGFQALLGRLSGQDDVVVGIPVAGRVRAETEELIGCFLNNLALRTDLAGNPGFRELLGRARATALEAYEHQDVPFERLLEELRVERDLSRTPLFQVFLNMLNFPTEEGGLGGTDEGMTADVPSKFDLTIYAGETAAGLRLEVVYNADLFDHERIAELAAQLELLLARGVESPETPIREIPLLTPTACAVLPDPAQPLPRARLGSIGPIAESIPERVAEHARRQPDAVAAVDRGGAWTYGRLDAHAGRLARRLREAGVGTGDIVAVFAHRGAGLAAALLGVWRTGAAFAILDPAYPPARLAAIVDSAHPGALLRMEAAGALPPAMEERLRGVPRLDLPEREAGWEALGSPDHLSFDIGPDDLAYVAFTSGSTGVPKGILGSHAPLPHFLDWHARTFELTGEDRFSVLSGLAHDPLLRDLFAPLWVGGTLCVPDPDTLGEPGRLTAWMARERVTVTHLTPAMGLVLAEGGAPGVLPELRRAFFGGDVLTGADLARLEALAPRVEVVNFYGATETPQAMGWWQGRDGEGAVPLGRGIDGVDLLVLNPAGGLAGIGELGEIAIRTPYLALGYLGDPAATAERFAVDPFAAPAGARAYRTGDLGRYRPDGAVAFAGRADAQVKIRGFRVETGEIEAVLARHPAVREAAVVLAEALGDRPLIAFVVLDPAAAPEPPDLRGWLRGQLPAYMIPVAVLPLERLPLTPNRKVDRRALARLGGRPERGTGGVEPRGPVEEGLAVLWGDLLGTDPARIGVHDDFFDLGGHSLLATQILSRIRDRFSVELPLRAVFERPTIAGLAELIAVARPETALPPLVRRSSDGDSDEDPPLSFAQDRLWFLHHLDPGTSAYNMYQALRLDGALDEAALAEALREVVRRQEALRSRLVTRGTRTVQVVDPVPATMLPVADLAALPAAARADEAERLVRQEALRPFDIEQGPVLRALLVRLEPAERRLLIAMHHIVSDGWSMGVFVQEMTTLYEALAAGRPSPLPPLPVQYGDFARWQREWLTGEVLDREVAWWRERLSGAPAVLDLPLDRPRPALHTFHGGRRSRRLGPAASEALLHLGRTREATPFMTGLALYAALLQRHTGSVDLVVGTPIANRNRQEIEGLIGFFANTLALRVDLSGAPGFGELLDRVRETALGAYSHQDVPFEKLVEELAPARNLRHTPLFQVMFILGGAPLREMGSGGLRISLLQIESQAAKFDLTLMVEESDTGLGLTFGYNSDRFFATTIERLLEHAETLAAALVADPVRPVAELPLLAPAERHQLLREWNDTAAPVSTALLHELFEARAAEDPEAPAVLEGDAAVSYGDLDVRANQLARHLRRLGVGPEVRVGLCVERSAGLILGILGILKAGGAWVPMDPSWPAERLALLPEDAGVHLLLTQQHLTGRLGSTADLLLLDRDREEIERESAAPLRSGITPDNAAYVIYTSGSTGRPNGVLIPHRAAVSFVLEARRHFATSRTSRVLQAGSAGFDMSVKEIFMALAAGSALCIATEDERRDPALLAERISRQRIDVAALTPKVVSLLPQAPVRGLVSLSVGGEACPAGLAPRWASGRRFFNCYGPTETTVYATVEFLSPDEQGVPSIGRPLENVQAFLLDAGFREVPIGVAGELCLGGTNLARGYLDRPDRTAARFVPHPFATTPGARLYRTGDLARQRPDGRLDYLGRIDQQVKISGVRIEPGEIETALLRHPAVRAAVVDAREDGTGDLALVAWLAADPAPSDTELRAFLAQSLPDVLIPAAFVILPALPLNASGKVDRKALPEPRRVVGSSGTVGVPPRTELERFLAGLWQETLGSEGIGVHDNFFELGGSSIKAAILTNLLQERLGEYVYVVALFDAPTIARLAVYLEEQYPAAVARLTGRAADLQKQSAVRLDESSLALFRSIIEPLPPWPAAPDRPRNPRAVFVLSPPRSGSTLLRVMLAGHPGLFAPPELELLGFNTLGERKEAFSGRYSLWAEGTVRALMALEGCGPDEAWAIMADAEARDLPVRDFYGWMQDRLGSRLLVDKTPSYALDPAVLARAEEDFDEPLYIHILRHPHAMIASFEKARLEQVFFRQPHGFARRQLAELIWVTSQENILAHLSGIPAERQIQLRFEDLVRDPRTGMERVCALLGIDFHPAMLDPYEDSGSRMTDGIHALTKMVGDIKFHEHRQVDAGVADRWREEIEEDFLGAVTWDVAASLGYERPEPERPSPVVRLQAGGPGRPFFCAHAVGGHVFDYAGLARELAPDRPFYGLQSLGLDGGAPQTTVEEMAATYLEEILKVQPEGPWLLGGWSFGALLAWEMAWRLRRQEREVDLALIDPLPVGQGLPQNLFWRQDIDDAELLLGHLVPDLDPAAAEALQSEARTLGDLPPAERVDALLAAAQRLGALPAGLDPDQVRAFLRVYRANGEAARRYEPQPYAGPVLLVRASLGLARVDPLLGWGDRIVGEREIVDVEGDHHSILEGEELRALGRVLRGRLARNG